MLQLSTKHNNSYRTAGASRGASRCQERKNSFSSIDHHSSQQRHRQRPTASNRYRLRDVTMRLVMVIILEIWMLMVK